MTPATKPVRRESAVVVRGRPLVVELHAAYLTVRPKGTRQAVSVDYRTILETGYKILARAAAAEKAARKKARE